MMFDNAANFYRKFGVAEWRDSRFLSSDGKTSLDEGHGFTDY